MQKQLTDRQTGLILIVSILANKLLMLPGIMCFESKNSAYLVFLLSFLIDFLFVMIFLYINQKIDMPIFKFLENRFGKIVAIVFALPIIMCCSHKRVIK